MRKVIIFLFFFNSITAAQSNNFDFRADKRLFISYAFMNAAGNDAEWNKEGMHPIRVEVRKYLFEKLDSSFLKNIREYVLANNILPWPYYSTLGLMSDGTPEFNIDEGLNKNDLDSLTLKRFLELRKYLIEFYKKSDIEELWKKYQPEIQSENDKYIPFAGKAINDITSYCRIDSNYFSNSGKRISFQICPLMLYFTAQTVTLKNTVYIISGPKETSNSPSAATFYHEALHHPVGAVIDKYAGLVDKYSVINSIAKRDLGYEKWNEFLEDCLVRTLDLRLEARLFNYSPDELNKYINNEYKIGMLLCPYFNEELSKYEKSNLTLEEYFPKLLSNLSLSREKQRLEEFRKNTK